jgi:hypothetical protein
MKNTEPEFVNDSMDSIPPAYVAFRAGTSNRVVVPARQAGNRFLGSLKGLQIRAQAGNETDRKRRMVERIFLTNVGKDSGGSRIVLERRYFGHEKCSEKMKSEETGRNYNYICN